ncbi:hypothetical protein [Ramlibacter alkalitolerans]|jgi:hypothetical protein|uniref:Uncharacterized protein n=1 Tax=Ramlibacter alkalitolerans TaxID=2039631 RepID=A0ABS1JLG2_9BURK|nr:hypothetical protein [Ramlibacter alkalitolerans]MBL0425067.1 hypothetical protein [Ramlibacter alkalitolerans]
MRPRLPALFAAGLVLAAPALATHFELEAYDLRKCLQWSITRAEHPVRTADYRAAKARARGGLEVFAATAELPEGGSLHKFGACSYRHVRGKPVLGCVPVLDFPLAGATFVLANDQRFRSATVLRCASGCDQKIPDLVYELDDTSSPVAVQEREERARGARLRRACAGLR